MECAGWRDRLFAYSNIRMMTGVGFGSRTQESDSGGVLRGMCGLAGQAPVYINTLNDRSRTQESDSGVGFRCRIQEGLFVECAGWRDSPPYIPILLS